MFEAELSSLRAFLGTNKEHKVTDNQQLRRKKDMSYELDTAIDNGVKIKVIGIGGGGNNTI
ncbi:MAG: hypothetical protein IJF24_00325, partial [Clostridia bacterium]|nr:hypothetical protein [Clostridia bacterium]